MTQRVNVEDYVEDLWKLLKDNLLIASDNSCGWTKGPLRHKATVVEQRCGPSSKEKASNVERMEARWF